MYYYYYILCICQFTHKQMLFWSKAGGEWTILLKPWGEQTGGLFFFLPLFTNQVFFFLSRCYRVSPKICRCSFLLRQPCVIFLQRKNKTNIRPIFFFVVDLPTHFNKLCSVSSFLPLKEMGLRRKREMVRMMQSPSAFDQSIQVKMH